MSNVSVGWPMGITLRSVYDVSLGLLLKTGMPGYVSSKNSASSVTCMFTGVDPENWSMSSTVCQVSMLNSTRLQKVRKEFPETCFSMGPKEILKLLLASFGLYNKKVFGHCLQVPIYHYGIKLVTRRFVKYVQSIGLKIHVWTINDVKTMEKLIDLDVDGIITDRPKLLKEVLSKN